MRLLYSVTLALGAMLLFLLELIFAKMLLPLLGGAPEVWITSLLFFQAMLLAAYAIAHVGIRFLGARRQSPIQLVLSFVPVVFLPFAVPGGWVPPATVSNPVPWVLLVLLLSVGLPFFALASASPVLQAWFAASGKPDAGRPYGLFRWSNVGSLVGLLSFPFLLEPFFGETTLRNVWTFAYLVWFVLVAACAVWLWRQKRPETSETQVESASKDPPTSWGLRWRWLALAFVPSVLVLGTTEYLTNDIAPVPLLWVLPLSLYLLSFMLVFSPRYGRLHRAMSKTLPFLALPLIVLMLLHVSYLLSIAGPLALGSLFAAAIVCHGELALSKPEPRRLTEFYLWIALGGMLGGVAVVLVAPLVFKSFAEVPLALAGALLLRPRGSAEQRSKLDVRVALAVFATLVVLFLVARPSPVAAQFLWAALFLTVASLVCLSFAAKTRRFAYCVLALMLASALVPLGQLGSVVYSSRDFFGAFRVVDEGDIRYLYEGNTVHGAQNMNPAAELQPLTYFSRSGPLGDIFDDAGNPPSVGVIGLGTGSSACYAAPADQWTFYEINPDIVQLAETPSLFRYLSDCKGVYHVVEGDARLSLASAAPSAYDLFIVDAFNSDAIPVHLLTTQAMALYGQKLTQDGLLAFNISNRYLNLAPVLGNLAAARGWTAYVRSDENVSAAERSQGIAPSEWVVMSRSAAALAPIAANPEWERLEGQPGSPVWTDDYSNVLGALRLHW